MEELHVKEIVNTRQCQGEGVKVPSTYTLHTDKGQSHPPRLN